MVDNFSDGVLTTSTWAGYPKNSWGVKSWLQE
jgi:hypothetical protein